MRILGYALLIGGAVGIFGRLSVYSANQSGSTGNVSPLANYDPATALLKIAPTGSLVDAGTMVDAALVLGGLYLIKKG